MIEEVKAPQERPGRIEYLFLTADEAATKKVLDDAIDELPPFVRLRCRNPELRYDHGRAIEHYPHMDYDERTPPDPFTAARMCTTGGKMCAVADQCLAYAMVLKPRVGVWGARAFVDGAPLGITNNKEAAHDRS